MDYNLSKSRFLNSIDKYAKKKRLKLVEEIRQIENDKLVKEESKIIEQAKFLMMSELTDVKSKISLKIYKEQTNALQQVCKRRSEIENEVFDLCKKHLEEFTKSDLYLSKLESSLKYASEFFKNSFDVSAREQDISYLKQLRDLFKIENIFVDSKIKHGGLVFKKGNVILDDSFDYHLKEQRNFFAMKCASELV